MAKISDFGNWKLAAELLATEAARNPFVQRQIGRSSVSAGELQSDPEAWAKLAFIMKDDMMEDQRLKPPFGTRCTFEVPELSIIVESSGTTALGKEVHCITKPDYDKTMATWGLSLKQMGIGPKDVIGMTLPVGMSGGGVKHVDAYVAMGAKMMRIANLSTRAKLDAMAYYGMTVVIGTPFYIDRLGAVADEAGIDVSKLKVRKLIVATQSVTVDWIKATEAKWNAKLYEWYGTASGMIAFSCEHGMLNDKGERGTLHWHPDFELNEIRNEETGALVDDGQRGEVIATPMVSEAEPLFRIRTRDEATFRAPGKCACGSHWPGIEAGTVRRLDGTFKVKGVNIWPSHCEAVIFSLGFIRDYRVRIHAEGGRETMQLDLLKEPGADAPKDLADQLGEKLRQQTGLGFHVVVVEDSAGWLHQTTGEIAKPRRWVDERMK